MSELSKASEKEISDAFYLICDALEETDDHVRSCQRVSVVFDSDDADYFVQLARRHPLLGIDHPVTIRLWLMK